MQELSDVRSTIIDKNIEKWKENLLDLTKRNNMINFKYNKKSVLKINNDLDFLYDWLITEESNININDLNLEYDLEDYEEKKELEKLLTKLRLKRNSHMKEKGINVLYLTLGMLKWKEADHSDIFMYSPILMIPVELTRANKNSPFRLKIFDNQCIVNPSLQFKLKADFGLELEEFGYDTVLSDYINNVYKLISEINKWEITEDSFLGLFSFSKIALYHDLIRYKERIKEHPVIGNVASGETIYSDEKYNEIDDVNGNESALDSYQVLDADSSQQEAAVTAKQGCSFVMQGPPGTGKSQTITNIIAECLAVGKKVLFVSEKMAALEVVKKRLKSVGLGDFCLELHSNKANKKTVITELFNQYSGGTSAKSEDTQFLYNYENIKEELNNYIEELHRLYPPLNKSAFWYHGKLSQLNEVEVIQFEVENINLFDQNILAQVEKLINELQLRQGNFREYNETFWRYTTIRDLSLSKTNDVHYNLAELINSIREISDYYNKLNRELEIKINTIANARELKNIFTQLNIGYKLVPLWFENLDFEKLIEIADSNKHLQEDFHELHKLLKNTYKTDSLYVEKELYMNSIDELTIVLKDSISGKLYQRLFREELIKELISFGDNLEQKEKIMPKIKSIFGNQVQDTLYELKSLKDVMKILIRGNKVPNEWFNSNQYIEREVLPRINEDTKIHENIKSKTEMVSHVLDKQILHEDLNNLFVIFNKQVLSDVQYKNSLDFIYKKDNNLVKDISDSLDIVTRIISSGLQLKEILGFEPELTIQNIEYLIRICESISKIHYCKKEWLNENDFIITKRKVAKFKEKLKDLDSLNVEIEEKFEKNIFNIYSDDMFTRFKDQYTSAFRIFKGTYRKDKKQLLYHLKVGQKFESFNEMFRYIGKIHSYYSSKKEIENNEHDYIDLLGNLYQDIDSDIELIDNNFNAIKEYIDLCQKIGYKNSKFETFIFDKDNLDKIYELKNILSSSLDVYKQKLQTFEKELDLSSIDIGLISLKELETSTQEKLEWVNSVLQEIQQIRKYANSTLSLNFNDLVNYVHTMEDIINLTIITSNNKEKYKETYGFLYQGIHTKWDVIVQLTEWIKMLHESSESLNNEQKESLINFQKNRSEKSGEELKSLLFEFNTLLELLQGNLRYFSNLFMNTVNNPSYLENDNRLNVNLSSFKDIIKTTYRYIDQVNQQLNKVEAERIKPFSSIDEVNEDIKNIDQYNSINEQIAAQEQKNIQLFESLYKHTDTNWNEIKQNLEQAKLITNKAVNCNITLTSQFVKLICSGNKTIFQEEIKQIEDYIVKFTPFNEYYNTIIDLEEKETEFYSLENMSVSNAIYHIDTLINDMENLELVVKMRIIQDDFSKANLEDFFLKVISKDNLNASITDIFYKSIYTTILDELYAKNDILKRFEKTRFEGLLKNFRELDKKQLSYNSVRVRNRLLKSRNELIKSRQGRQQSGVLAHENGKKKRHIPLRKLFGSMPDLLASLKPCMLMSPLSVCEFLDLDLIQFDLVIFDEASQICPEDAITPMLRGKDVVIAGDIHQLPPTRFFKTDLSVDEFDDDEEDGTVVYESILDLCANIMPQKTLKWHYRSRHESLIAYSNKNFYSNALYTFPSPEFTNEKQGVKFAQVKDGIYDRSGKRTNSKEADKVVELVFNHFREYSNRSLGVIAFSQSQMEEIQDKIYEKLNIYPELEHFFNENKEDAFFVKNLENVQGDERDTIIISVGYGKDLNGNLNHNFGPLNKAGGERRLNVAVTRSKEELILVTSINDNDIDLKRTNSVGVRLLKEFIQYARTGKLVETIFVNNKLEFDSPLEQDIYNSIVKLGYEVHTQVGNSGYRIDLAIVDPKNKGRYILGVECDGATYHSTKSARDRDRLRQEVLENLGWKIYRIWSQDWFKQKEKEVEKIANFLKNLVNV